MKSALICLQEKKDAFDKMKKNYEDTVAYIQVILDGNSSMIHVYIEVMQPIFLSDVYVFILRSKLDLWRGEPARSLKSFALSCKPRKRPGWTR